MTHLRRPRTTRQDFFTPEQFAKFLSACPPWLAAFAEFGTLTGLRPGEIRRLEYENVSDRAGVKHDGEEFGLIHLRADQTKSGREETVILLPRAREILLGLPVNERHPFYFLGANGRPITKGSLRHHFEEARRKAGLTVARPHMLRHTAASWLIQRGVPLPFVQQILRHRNYQTTLGYTHFLPQHLAPAMAVLAENNGGVNHAQPTPAIRVSSKIF